MFITRLPNGIMPVRRAGLGRADIGRVPSGIADFRVDSCRDWSYRPEARIRSSGRSILTIAFK